jgi:hypothetical protein
MIKEHINKWLSTGIFTYALIFIALYVLYATYELYRFHSHEKHIKNIHISVDFIPADLCGSIFEKDEIITEEEIFRHRDLKAKLNRSVAIRDYYIGFTVENKSSKSISKFVVSTDIFFPYDKKLNLMNDPLTKSILFEPRNNKKLMSGQYVRRCMPVLLSRDYSDAELLESRRLSKIDWVKW